MNKLDDKLNDAIAQLQKVTGLGQSILDWLFSHARVVLLVMLMIFVSGIVSYASMSRELQPDITVPVMYTYVSYSGISPEDSNRMLLKPLEKEVRNLEGAKKVTSKAYSGGASVVVEFAGGYSLATAYDKFKEAVEKAEKSFPSEADKPQVHEINLSEEPILSIHISGSEHRVLMQIARSMQDILKSIPGVLDVSLKGGRSEVIEIEIDPLQMENYNLQANTFGRIIRGFNTMIPAGSLSTGSGHFSVNVPGLIDSVDDLLEMPALVSGDKVVKIKDVADVRYTFKDPTSFARVFGEKSVTLEVSKRTGENLLLISSIIRTVVNKTIEKLPPSINISYSNDKSDWITFMLSSLENNVIFAIILVMCVVMVALGLSSGLLVAISIPGSFLFGLLILNVGLGVTLNMVVMFSLILAVGILVDGAIVVIEYAQREMYNGVPREVAYKNASLRMFLPVTASTATTVAAFLPLFFWPDIVGEFMGYLPLTLVAVLLSSLCMALLFIPVLGANITVVVQLFVPLIIAVVTFFAAQQFLPVPPDFLTLVSVGVSVILFVISFFVVKRQLKRSTNVINENWQSHSVPDIQKMGLFYRVYAYILRSILKSRLRASAVICLALLAMVSSWVAYGKYGKGVVFFPDSDASDLKLDIYAQGNYSPKRIDQMVRDIEQELQAINDENKEYKSMYTKSGVDNGGRQGRSDSIGTIYILFDDWNKRRRTHEIVSEIEERIKPYTAGLKVETKSNEMGPPSAKLIDIQVSGEDVALLLENAEKVKDILLSLDYVKDIESDYNTPGIELYYDINKEEASKYGLDVAGVGNMIKMATAGLKITTYRSQYLEDEVDVVLRLPKSKRNIDQIDNFRINTSRGPIPINYVVERSVKHKQGTIINQKGIRTFSVKADVVFGTKDVDALNKIQSIIDEQNWPLGVDVALIGDNEDQNNSKAFLQKAFLIALFLIFLILLIEFNNFFDVFLILITVIMSTVGVFIGLIIMNLPFSIVMGGIGVIALAGIVVNNNIVLIDTYRFLNKKIDNLADVIVYTCCLRARPVIITTVTTVIGLLPMVLKINLDFASREVTFNDPNTQFWQLLATAIVFGLMFATFLTLFVTPSALYLRGRFFEKKEKAIQNTES